MILSCLALFSSLTHSVDTFIDNSYQTPSPEIHIAALPTKPIEQIAPFLRPNPNRALLVYDLDSGKTLFHQNEDHPKPIASLTKLMTGLLILENHDLDEVVSIPLAATKTEGAKIDLYEHEKLTVQTLLESLFIASANDAAVALAIFHSGSEEAFVQEMNKRAFELELYSAHFLNSTGLDIIEEKSVSEETLPENEDTETDFNIQGNRMSAWDLLLLSRKLLTFPFVVETAQKDNFAGTSVDEKFFHEKKSTNQLLNSFLNITGLKTGFTYLAGECFVALGKTQEGKPILSVVLGSHDRFGETTHILSWIYDTYTW